MRGSEDPRISRSLTGENYFFLGAAFLTAFLGAAFLTAFLGAAFFTAFFGAAFFTAFLAAFFGAAFLVAVATFPPWDSTLNQIGVRSCRFGIHVPH